MRGWSRWLLPTAVAAIVLSACAEEAESRPNETDASSTADPSETTDTAESSAATSLPAGDLPEALSLKAVKGRTIRAEPFADFAVAADDGVWVSGVAPGVVRYNANGDITARAGVPGDVVQALEAADGHVLVTSLNPNLLLNIDAATGAVRDRVRLPDGPVGEATIGAAGGRAYVLVDPASPKILVVEDGSVVDRVQAPEAAVAVRAGYGSLWVPTSEDTVERYDLGQGTWTSIAVGPLPRFLDVGFDAVWVMNQGDGSVSRIDARSGSAEQIAVTGEPIGGGDLTVGAGAVWLRTDSAVARLDPRTRSVTHLIELPPGSASAAATDGALVISNHDHGAVHVVPLPLPS